MLPGWSSQQFTANPLPLALPTPYRALYTLPPRSSSEYWIDVTWGSADVAFDWSAEAFALIQVYVFGVVLLDCFALDVHPLQYVRRILFGEPGYLGGELTLTASPKRLIIFGEVGENGGS